MTVSSGVERTNFVIEGFKNFLGGTDKEANVRDAKVQGIFSGALTGTVSNDTNGRLKTISKPDLEQIKNNLLASSYSYRHHRGFIERCASIIE